MLHYPALVISPFAYNQKVGLALFMPITSHVKGYPFEHCIDCDEIKGAVLCDQIRSLDWKERKAKFILQLPKCVVEDILAKFQVLIE